MLCQITISLKVIISFVILGSPYPTPAFGKETTKEMGWEGTGVGGGNLPEGYCH